MADLDRLGSLMCQCARRTLRAAPCARIDTPALRAQLLKREVRLLNATTAQI